MNHIGIIAEYNPFHSGHRHHIQKTREKYPDSAVLVIMSGHWVQQANCAILDKWTRSKIALEGGADLVIELPSFWATSSAQGFARGAISLLDASSVVKYLSFGSESGNIELFHQIQKELEKEEFSTLLKEQLKTGCSYPKARQNALEQVLGEEAKILSTPNNTLGLEYLAALNHYNSPIIPFTIPREGAGFHQTGENLLHTSATDIRHRLQQNRWVETETFLSPMASNLLKNREFPSFTPVERAILGKIYAMSVEDWIKLPDSGAREGLPQRCYKVAQSAQSLSQFIEGVKTKRYTHGRIRRLVLRVFLGMEEAFPQKEPPYLRILGMNRRGCAVLQEMKQLATLPILTKTAQVNHFSQTCQDFFQKESIYTDLYGLCFQNPPPRGLEWTQSPVRDFTNEN